MMNPIKLILAGLLALISGCGESADLKKQAKDSKHAAEGFELASSLLPATATEFVGGVAPNRRPADAPAIREFTPGDRWRSQFMAGISEPIPASLDFIDDQGAWYTPFNQPGMPGLYDIRNLHYRARDTNSANR